MITSNVLAFILTNLSNVQIKLMEIFARKRIRNNPHFNVFIDADRIGVAMNVHRTICYKFGVSCYCGFHISSKLHQNMSLAGSVREVLIFINSTIKQNLNKITLF